MASFTASSWICWPREDVNRPECVEWNGEAMKQRLSFKNLPKIQATRFKKLRLEKERATPMRGAAAQETVSA